MSIVFQEIPASESGIDYTGITWGGAWGDVNGDGYPDIWLNNHYAKAQLYLNQGNGIFEDVTTEWFGENPNADFHGAAWADFDNDGDQDLVQSVGAGYGIGSGPKKLYINENGTLEDQASLRGVDYPLARGRGVLWLDYNNDRRLDLIMGADPRMDDSDAPVKIFEQQTDGTFQDVSSLVGLNLAQAPYFLLSDLSGDGNPELIARTTPLNIYDISSLPFFDITSETISGVIPAQDMASADFNGDLLPDLYLTQSAQGGNDLYQSDSDSFVVKLSVNAQEKATQFKTLEEVTFNIDSLGGPFSIPVEEVYIGSTGIHPTTWQFTLSAQNAETEGIFPHTPGVDRGIYLGYDSDSNYWSVILSSPNTNQLIAMIDASTTITDLTAIGFNAEPQLVQDQLLINTAQGLINKSQESGINGISTGSNSVVAGDFDNDMDQDIYIVTTRSVVNTPNILYENQGDGTFVALPDAGGAAGTTLGIGDFVVTADYDLDGFLDLLVGNGFGPKTPITDNAPYELFENQGNENHWLQIDLEGVISNRDGIGAQLFLTANGITQLSQQDGGVHGMVQDDQRIHFGLGENTLADSLTIRWSSGIVQRIVNIAADQIIKIKEPTINKLTLPGSSKQDFLLGTGANDLIKGFANSDTLRGEEGDDTLKGGKGNNSLSGGKGNDILIGAADADILFGEEGDDLLKGGKSNDTLSGGTGNDTLKGGAGLDQFTLANYNNLAQLPDFRPGDDVIAISASGFGGNLTQGSTPELQLGSTADDASDRLIYNQATGELFFDQDGNAIAFSQVTIAILSKQPSLSSGDFIII